MCGIIGTLDTRNLNTQALAIRLLRRLEYRGYDSFGYVSEDSDPRKYLGAISKSDIHFRSEETHHITIAHTRWATHGKVNIANTHPHTSAQGIFSIVHNGVISNSKALRAQLEEEGYTFYSDTDTEVAAYVFEQEYLANPERSQKEVIGSALAKFDGEYAFVILSKAWPNSMVCVKKESPLIFAMNETTCVVASDEAALAEEFSDCVHLEDGEIITVERIGSSIWSDLKYSSRKTPISVAKFNSESLEGFPDFMSKEMSEIPDVIRRANLIDVPKIHIGERVLITGCGSAYYAAWIGNIFRRMSSPKVTDTLAYPADEAECALDLHKFDRIIAISQSGETYDTLRALRDTPSKKMCITNVRGSKLYRTVDEPIFQDAGPEKCVLSTKSIISQCVILFRMFRQYEANCVRSITVSALQKAWQEVFFKSDTVAKIKEIAHACKDVDNFFFIGRGVYVPVAMENALKLKEVTYCHAEGMGAGFFKHGTLSLIDDRFVVFAHLPDTQYPRDADLHALTEANISEIEARGGRVIRIGHTEGCDIVLPNVRPELNALLHLGVGQFLAYHMAKILDRDVDQPRSLAKSVTVR